MGLGLALVDGCWMLSADSCVEQYLVIRAACSYGCLEKELMPVWQPEKGGMKRLTLDNHWAGCVS